MSFPNGQWPNSALMKIPGGRLAKTPARSYLAMRYYIGHKTGVWLTPTGPNSSYRDLATQKQYWQAHLNGTMPQPVARPGMSFHGEGQAVDLRDPSMWAMVRKYGAKFGWGIAGNSLGSDAPSEAWHSVYKGGKWLNATARLNYFRYQRALRKGK